MRAKVYIIRQVFATIALASLGWGCGTIATLQQGAETTGSSATKSARIAVTGSTVDTCTVTGAQGKELGSGPASGLSFNYSAEESAVVTCGDQAAVFTVGDASIALDTSATAAAGLMKTSSLGQGSRLIAQSLKKLDLDSDHGGKVGGSLVSFLDAWDKVRTADQLAATGKSIIKFDADEPSKINDIIELLLSMGEPVVVEKIGSGKTIATCTDEDVEKFGDDLVATDASAIGMTGCLVYHSLYAITDLNNPLFSPDNVPDAFRSVATESGVVQELRDSTKDELVYTLDSVHEHLFTTLGHTVYTEDDEGVVTAQTVTAAELETFFTSFLTSFAGSGATDCGTNKSYVCHIPPGNPDNPNTLCVSDNAVDTHLEEHGDSMGKCREDFDIDDFRAYRFHTGYNPSGGWEIDAAATPGSYDAACTDSSPTTVCTATPLKFDFDGTTLTQDADGDYIIRMEYRGGAFQNFANVLNLTTSKPYRDANYQPVKATITPADYSPINYANPFYDSCLDPMRTGGGYGANCDGGGETGGTSAPFANTTFKTLYPGMTNVDNAYVLPNPEIVVRLDIILQNIEDFDQLTAWQAFAVMKMVNQAMASIPLDSGLYAIPVDHGKTPAQWDSLTTTWLQSGASSDDD